MSRSLVLAASVASFINTEAAGFPMKIELSKPFASNSIVEEYDVIQMKKALNRLGYYQPYEKAGITSIADHGVFEALKEFQKDHNLPATGTAKPDDETVKALNKEASKTPEGQYIWRTVEDDKVRGSHAQYNRTIRDWNDSPDPGEDFNCRCWAEPVNTVGLTQKIISEIYDLSDSWGNIEFLWYFYFGSGRDVKLPQMGLFEPVIKHAERIMFDRVKNQVADKAKKTGSGTFTGSWNNSYEF